MPMTITGTGTITGLVAGGLHKENNKWQAL